MTLRHLGSVIKDLSTIYLSKKGYLIGTLINDWALIVGATYEDFCNPDKVTFFKKGSGGTLHVWVYSQSMMVGLQHLQPYFIEKINTYFGYSAIEKIFFKKGVKKYSKNTPKNISVDLGKQDNAAVNHLLEEMQDGPLKESLKRLGNHLISCTKIET